MKARPRWRTLFADRLPRITGPGFNAAGRGHRGPGEAAESRPLSTQIRSSVIDTASQAATENGNAASVLAVGAGLANAAAAVANTLVVVPATASLGIVKPDTLPATVNFQLTNTGATTLNLSIAINRLTPENNAHTSINLPNVTLTPGASNMNLSLLLSGSVPAPGIYQGFIAITGAPNPIHIPYLYTVGDGVPADIISVAGSSDEGIAGMQSQGGYIIVEVIDRYGVPVTGQPVNFSVTSGGGQLTPLCVTICAAPNDTDNYGTAAAAMVLGPNPGSNVYSATAGSLSASFTATGFALPSLLPNGVVNAASYANQPLAPGSYITLFGNNLAPSTSVYSTSYLPVSLNQVSVSFDAEGVSVPAHIVFVSTGQVTVQVPWELQGESLAQVKVSVSDSPGSLYTMRLAPYSPALFVIPSGGQNIAAALDQNSNIVTASNPAKRGQIVQLYANGMGPVSNQPNSGDPAPSLPLAETTTTPIVTIGGAAVPPQNVQFSGLAPGNAALYQVNVTVPQTITAGLQPVTISIGGIVSPVVLLPVQ